MGSEAGRAFHDAQCEGLRAQVGALSEEAAEQRRKTHELTLLVSRLSSQSALDLANVAQLRSPWPGSSQNNAALAVSRHPCAGVDASRFRRSKGEVRSCRSESAGCSG